MIQHLLWKQLSQGMMTHQVHNPYIHPLGLLYFTVAFLDLFRQRFQQADKIEV